MSDSYNTQAGHKKQ